MSDEFGRLRARINQVVEYYSNAIGSVPLQLLEYHVNNFREPPNFHTPKEEGGGSKLIKLNRRYSTAEITEQLAVLENLGYVERTVSWKPGLLIEQQEEKRKGRLKNGNNQHTI